MKSVTQPCKGPHSSWDFWVIRCWKAALCIMGNFMKCSTIGFVNLFSLFFFSRRHTAEILLLCSTTSIIQHLLSRLSSSLAGGARVGSQRPSCTLYGSDEIWFWKIEEIWIINGRLACDNVCSGSVQREKEMRHTHAFLGTPVFLKDTESYCAALLNHKDKKKGMWQENNNNNNWFYLPIFTGTLLFHSYFFFLSNQSFTVEQ